MTETIGGVLLIDDDYPGTDLYSDGAVEDELLEIAKNEEPEEFDRVAAQRKSWPVLYHFSGIRQNILNWYPIGGSDRVLEIGSGCGAVTPALAERAGHVDCVELSRKRSLVNAWRNRRCDNIAIRLGNFEDVEKKLPRDYTRVTMIGVFEYGVSYISSQTPYVDFLRKAASHLCQGGRLLIAIENRLGMKYFAGCAEDHTGRFFDGIEGYPKSDYARTFSRKELEELLKEAGFTNWNFYYPYPDYKFPMTVFSDRRLPGPGELRMNMMNFDRKRMVLFDEAAAFDALAGSGEFPVFSNSFLIEAYV